MVVTYVGNANELVWCFVGRGHVAILEGRNSVATIFSKFSNSVALSRMIILQPPSRKVTVGTCAGKFELRQLAIMDSAFNLLEQNPS